MTNEEIIVSEFEDPVVLLAGGPGTRMKMISESINKTLLDVAGQPLIGYWLDQLSNQGVRRAYLCGSHRSESLFDYAGRGNDWGMEIIHSIEREPYGTGAAFARVNPNPHSDYLVLYGDVIGRVDIRWMRRQHQIAGRPASCFVSETDAVIGWYLNGALFESVPFSTPLDIEAQVGSQGKRTARLTIPGEFIDVNAPDDLIAAQERILTGRWGFSPAGDQRAPGVWICPGAQIHSSVQLIAPVFIGNETRIMSGAVIGPNVSLSNRCIVEPDAAISHTAVQPRTCIGRGTEVHDAIARPYQVVTQRGADVEHIEKQLNDAVRSDRNNAWIRRLPCLFAFLTAPVWMPLTLLFAVVIRFYGRRPAIIARSTLATGPVHQGRFSFRRYEFNIDASASHPAVRLFVQLPSMINVLIGQLRIVGIEPIAHNGSMVQETGHWQALKCGNPGIIPYSRAFAGPDASREERLMCDAWHVANRRWTVDVAALRRGLLALIAPERARRWSGRNASVSSV